MITQPNYGRNHIGNSYLAEVCDEIDTWNDLAYEIRDASDTDHPICKDDINALKHINREMSLVYTTWDQF